MVLEHPGPLVVPEAAAVLVLVVVLVVLVVAVRLPVLVRGPPGHGGVAGGGGGVAPAVHRGVVLRRRRRVRQVRAGRGHARAPRVDHHGAGVLLEAREERESVIEAGCQNTGMQCTCAALHSRTS